ncbi:MAG: hypothetical protein H6Q73_1918 [Firmicutes bacterium]|nr:hypothetical protein [Bacillota bacterium]
MGQYNENWIDDTSLEFPRGGFWLVHILGAVVIFFLGMRFAVRRTPFSLIAYRMLRMLTHR